MDAFQRLDKASGSFCLIQAPSLAKSPIVRAYHLELLEAVQQIDGWYEEESDPLLFENYEPYYQAIAQHLKPCIEPKGLTRRSRHRFFIATELVPDPHNPDHWSPGLSELEVLMGFTYPGAESKSSQAVPQVPVTTGNYCLDLEASLLLFRPDQAQWLRQTFSPPELAEMLKYAQQKSSSEEETSEAQQEADREFFAKHEAAITAQLGQVGGGFLG